MQFKALFKHFREMKHYFIVSVLVFGIGLLLGAAYADQFSAFLKNEVQGIQKLSNFLSEKNNQQLWFFVVIFLNNTTKAIMFIFLGLLFGVLPLFMLIANGMILGYVLTAQSQESTWMLVLKGIVPHGIFEIPAILLACAYGIKLGGLVGKMTLHAFLPKVGIHARSELGIVLKLTKPLIIVITSTLLIAAVIESTVTFWLMSG
jgi:stage II sporulation protein M